MKYKDRAICGLINRQGSRPELRCPVSEHNKNDYCDGCELFETYLKFKERSMKLQEEALINKKLDDIRKLLESRTEDDELEPEEYIEIIESIIDGEEE